MGMGQEHNWQTEIATTDVGNAQHKLSSNLASDPRQLCRKKGKDQLPKYESGCTGVTWNRHHNHWCAQMSSNGNLKCQNFKPNNQTPHEIERSRLDAIACRKSWEQFRSFGHKFVQIP